MRCASSYESTTAAASSSTSRPGEPIVRDGRKRLDGGGEDCRRNRKRDAGTGDRWRAGHLPCCFRAMKS